MAANYRFEIYKDTDGKFRFRFVAPNGQNMFQGQSYTRKQSAIESIESIKSQVKDAPIEDMTKEA